MEALVDEHRLLGLVVGRGNLHLGVDGVQVPLERATLQPLAHRLPLADVTVGAFPELRPQVEVLLLIGGDKK